MSELALYRKYRSANWDEVVGQPHIVDTLRQAVASGRTSHAYLLTGPRGVGKTSVARILARSLNCSGPTKPCGQCPQCQAALAGNLDIIEIDAASNRGIDEIRDLREKINLAPGFGRFKVYIIDEVHMLTEAAFNALLKTLEEPPSHAVFVLATTEAHKLPSTIVSRTQRFSFHAIDTEVVANHLASVAQKEGIEASTEAIALLARAAGGSFRDGLSLLDQIAALGGKIEAADVRSLLGWGNDSEVEALAAAILSQDSAKALDLIDQLMAAGAEPGQLINQLTSQVRTQLHAAVRAKQDAAAIARLLESLITATKSPLPQYALEAAIARYNAAPVFVSNESAAPKPVAAAQTKPPAARPDAPAPKADAMTVGTNDFDSHWLKALALVKAQNNSLYALLCSCGTHGTGESIEILARFSFHRDRLNEPKNYDIIATAVKRSFGRELPVTISLQPERKPPADTEEELVSSALEILGGEVVE